jgi:hypothetical protein
MSTTEMSTAVREFEIGFDESEVAEMRRRLSATRWTERETYVAASAVLGVGEVKAGARIPL